MSCTIEQLEILEQFTCHFSTLIHFFLITQALYLPTSSQYEDHLGLFSFYFSSLAFILHRYRLPILLAPDSQQGAHNNSYDNLTNSLSLLDHYTFRSFAPECRFVS